MAATFFRSRHKPSTIPTRNRSRNRCGRTPLPLHPCTLAPLHPCTLATPLRHPCMHTVFRYSEILPSISSIAKRQMKGTNHRDERKEGQTKAMEEGMGRNSGKSRCLQSVNCLYVMICIACGYRVLKASFSRQWPRSASVLPVLPAKTPSPSLHTPAAGDSRGAAQSCSLHQQVQRAIETIDERVRPITHSSFHSSILTEP